MMEPDDIEPENMNGQPSPDAPSKPEAVVDELAGLKSEIADLKDRLLRAVAETENVRRRSDPRAQ